MPKDDKQQLLPDDFWRQSPKRRHAAAIQMVIGYARIGVAVVQGIFLVPLYLHYVGERLYGLWLATGGIIVWLGMLDLGIASLMQQRIAAAYGKEDSKGIGLYYFNGFLLQLALMSILFIAAVILAQFLPHLLKATPEEASILVWCIILASFSLCLTILNYGQMAIFNALQRPLFPGLMLIFGGIITICVIIFLFYQGWGLYAIPSGMLAGALSTFVVDIIYGISLVRKAGGHFRLDRVIMLDMLKLSPAMAVSTFGSALVGRIEPTLITLMMGPEVAVAFTLTKRAGDIVKMILDKFVGSVSAGFSHLYAEGDKQKAGRIFNQLMTTCFSVGLVCLGLYVVGNKSFISLWVGKEFYSGQIVTGLVALSIMMLVFSNLVSYLLGATGDIAKPSLMVGAEAVIRLLLMALLLPQIGVAGLPLAVVISCGIFFGIFYLRMVRRLSIGFANPRALAGKIGLGLLVFGMAYWLTNIVQLETWVTFIGFMAVLFLIMAVLVLPFDSLFRSFVLKRFLTARGTVN